MLESIALIPFASAMLIIALISAAILFLPFPRALCRNYGADHIGIACILGLSAFLSLHAVLEPVKSMWDKCLHMEL